MKIIAFFTDEGEPALSLSPTIRIRNVSDSSLVITDAAMTETGDGFYNYSFAEYSDTIDYTFRADGGATLGTGERYNFSSNELGNTNDKIDNIKTGGGGMVVQYPANVINKKDEKFKEEMKILLAALQTKMDLVVESQPQLDVEGINSKIQKSMNKIIGLVGTSADKTKEDLNTEIDKLVKRGEESHKEYIQGVADFTDKIYQLQENTKILPDSLNSQLVAYNKESLSKFKKLSKELNTIEGKIESLQTSTSKMSEAETSKLATTKEQIFDRISKLQTEMQQSSVVIPQMINEKMGGVTEVIELTQKKVIEAIDTNKEGTEQLGKGLIVLKELINTNAMGTDEVGTQVSTLTEQLKEFASTVPKTEEMDEKVSNITGKLANITKDITEFKASNSKEVKKITTVLPKISQKRDLSFTQDEINKTIKELQANNTKKIKVLRDNLEGISTELNDVKKEHSEGLSDVKKSVRQVAEEANLKSQLDLIKESEEKEENG